MPDAAQDRARLPQTLEITDEETGALLRTFFNLAGRWNLSDAEGLVLLGRPAARTYARWKTGQADLSRVPHDTRQRLSMVMGIHRSLRFMFRAPDRQHVWMRKANQTLGGQSAMQRMLAGEILDLAAVRSYLDAERGGW